MKIISLIFVIGMTAMAALSVRADVVVTYAEEPSRTTSSLSGTQVNSFNDLATDQQHNNVIWTGVGIYDQIYVLPVDQWGGAVDAGYSSGSPYSLQGAGKTVNTTTLTLYTPSAYFGIWWSAGDAANVLDFYSGGASGNLVAEFTTANLMAKLPINYYGNPRDRSLDTAEPYAFINFFGASNTVWDTVVFRNSSASGFESDNHTSRVTPWTPDEGPMPGVPVERVSGMTVTAIPEPASMLLISSVLVAGFWVRRRFID